MYMWKEGGKRVSRRRLVGAHSSHPTPTPTSTSSFLYLQQHSAYLQHGGVCVKNGLSYKNMKTRAGLGGVRQIVRVTPVNASLSPRA